MKFYIVDCFAEAEYQGNQLAVFIPDRPLSDKEMQDIAKEIGFSETSFVLSGKQPDGGYNVRIFTPAAEVPFAGHPVLGTAYVIRNYFEGGSTREIRLNLKAGQVPVFAGEDGFTMRQNQPEFGVEIERTVIASALSTAPDDILEDYPVQVVSTGLEAVIVPLRTIEALEQCRVNHVQLHAFHQMYCKCSVLVFTPQNAGMRVRVFTDDPGFPEDAATGSANGDLAAYLLRCRFFADNKISYTVSQGSEMGRPSVLQVNAGLENGVYTIYVGGHVQSVANGEWK